LINGEKIYDPVVVVVAHPDDETIGMGGRISCFESLTLVHTTNGAPNNSLGILNAGFNSPEAYSTTRFSELDQALRVLRAQPRERLRWGYADGELVFHLVELTQRLQVQLRGVSAVFTHAYEGGHPDHDACALAVQYATHRLRDSCVEPLQRIEFTSYFSLNKRLRAGSFWPDRHNPGYAARLTRDQRRRKTEGLKTFRTQEEVLKALRTQKWISHMFGLQNEMYRYAPDYDFRGPAPPLFWHYDAWCSITGRDWLRHAGHALDLLESSDSLSVRADHPSKSMT
jgi:LmbE family N-acetylglucosaminyl deacetylase